VKKGHAIAFAHPTRENEKTYGKEEGLLDPCNWCLGRGIKK